MSSSETLRFATFNASLNRTAEGQLISDLSTPDNAQARAIAEIIQRNNPDVLLLNEFDYDADGTALALFQDNYLSISQNGADPVEYPYVYVAPSNTGIPSSLDLDNSGDIGGPNDAFGFGFYPGQFGMVLLSKYPIDGDRVRTFQTFLWKDMPDALLPIDPATGDSWYSDEELESVRLSSKSHWDIPIQLENGEVIHVLASHPTPPVFDGPEDRNGTRNHDEIRFWSDYVTPGDGDYIYDDQGQTGGLEAGTKFVIMGDQNADPFDGDSTNNAILQLLNNPLVNTSVTPGSEGGIDAAQRQGGANDTHLGDPALDTADFADGTPGNLRADYVLPSATLNITDAGVFWPVSTDPLFPVVGDFDPAIGGFPSSDHRLVYADVEVAGALPDQARRTVEGLEFIGEITIPTRFDFENTEVGGLSGLAYDPVRGVYYALSDDRSETNPARFYTLEVDLSDGSLDAGDIKILSVTTLLDANGDPFAERSLDPEGIAYSSTGTLYISSEGDANALIDPFVSEFSLTGEFIRTLPVPEKFLPTDDQSSGIRNNLAFESLTLTPNQKFLYTATENALIQDGDAANLEEGSLSRVLQYDLTTGQPIKEFLYETDEVATEPDPATGFSTNGLVELLALDNTGSLLALERSFSVGVGNSVKLYKVLTQLTTDISDFDSLIAPEDTPFDTDPGEPFGVDAVAEKELLLDFGDLGLTLDNLEGLSLGPVLPDGRQSLLVVSDNNFSDTQFTQFLAFAIDTGTIPAVPPTLETPPEIRFGDPENPDLADESDPDDPAIYVHPTDPAQSFVITSLKNTGLKVFDLEGNELQEIKPDGVRYNNVDILYGFRLGNETVDLAVASDRGNDTLAIFRIDPDTQQLTDITAANLAAPEFSIFGEDDGEQTAYGLATYVSIEDGTPYVFTTQRDGAQVAQLKLMDAGNGTVTAEVIRTLPFDIPDDADPEDFQSEGIVIDRELGVGYVAIEGDVGILKFNAEPDAGDDYEVVASIDEPYLTADIEGLTLYYAANGSGYLLASSQGDSTFAVFDRQTNDYLGSFSIGNFNGIDSVEESDGADIINVPLGDAFPNGLLVVQDGSNEPAVVFQDPEDGEIQNFNANFKYIDWADIVANFDGDLVIDRFTYNPRDPITDSLPNGVASGDVNQNSAVLWARSTVLGEVVFEYSTDPTFKSGVNTATATVTNAQVPVKVDIEGLESGTAYYYRVTDAAGATESGQFSTTAALGEQTGLRFGVSGDWRGELAPYPAISNAAGQNLAFFVEHGDTIYADYPSPALPQPQAITLEDYRAKHAEVYSDRFGSNTWADLRASTPIYATIDDHEVINDFSGGEAIASDPRFLAAFPSDDPDALINDSTLFDNGLQAFQEYNPVRDEYYGETGDDRTANERKLYRSTTFGADAATFVLDTRSFRDEPLAAPDTTNPLDIGRFLTESLTLDREFLGDVQLADLKQDLLEAEAAGVTWKFIMVPEPIQELGIYNVDAFEGYAKERNEILKFIEDNDINNVVFIAADIHGTFVNNLTYQETVGGDRIATDVFEITTGSVAFDEPFGQTVIDVATATGLITPEQRAFYDALPIAPDLDDIPNDKDDFLEQAFNTLAIGPGGYDPLGLDRNLPQAEGRIDATLLQGDYVASHTYGWTQFDIDPVTQKLTVTTYGIEPYSEADLLADPEAILSRTPVIVSQFEVNPSGFATQTGTRRRDVMLGSAEDDRIVAGAGRDRAAGGLGDDVILGEAGNDRLLGDRNNRRSQSGQPGGDDAIYGGDGNDIIGGKSGNDRLWGDAGQDRLFGDDGDDLLRGGLGNDTLTGGDGSDTFILAAGEGTDRITDFEFGIDRIGIADGLTFEQLTVRVGDRNTAIFFEDEKLAILRGVTVSLSEADVVMV